MKKSVFAYLKGVSAALTFTFLALAITALLIKNVSLGSKALSGLTVFIKGASIALGSAVFCRSTGKKGALCGVLTGVTYSAVISFSSVMFNGDALSVGMVTDMGFSSVFGAVLGIIWVNIFS